MLLVNRPGWIARGTVFDSSFKRVERELRDYDSNLRLIWNPDCNEAGSWEVHWSPTWEACVEEGDLDWMSKLYSYKQLTPTKRTKIHFEIPYLHSNLVGEMRARDSWANAGNKETAAVALEKLYTENEQAETARIAASVKREMHDQMKDEKKYIQAYKDYVASGVNPLWFFKE